MTDSTENRLNHLIARVRKVRRWLVALVVLKIAALCLVSVSAYIGIYAWLDHRLNFGSAGRITALVLLAATVGFLVYSLTKSLLGHISCSGAANYIESKQSFEQQLVTAVEYYEKRNDYPYSRALAEHLVRRVSKDSEAFAFDSTVEKWRGCIFAAVILAGLIIVGLYIHDNYVYFSSYFTRLINPLSEVEPLSRTSLESITKDMVTAPESVVRFAAAIKGRIPEVGKLVLVPITEPNAPGDKSDGRSEEILHLQPSFDEDKKARFEGTRFFAEAGRFKYHFEAGAAFTNWHYVSVCEPPQIKSITAEITLPKRMTRRQWTEPYIEQIKDYTLEAIPGSEVLLTVETTENLNEAVVTKPDGESIRMQLDGANQFTTRFVVYNEGYVKFGLISAEGVANDNLPPLQVTTKIDEPPKFKLLSPDGDYLATNVASVPMTFEVTDDFGLSSVTMHLEMAGKEGQAVTIPVEKGTKRKAFTHTLELEEHDLTVGDSILFHAKAVDIDIGSALKKKPSNSDVYFIEIRPYRQLWRPKAGGGKCTGAPSAAKLLDILEYTRAILKKTWTVANKPQLTEQDRLNLDSINEDVEYCAGTLEHERDNTENNFDQNDMAKLNEILEYFRQASRCLAGHAVSSAIVPEKNAYRALRKFINELEKKLSPPSSGSSPPTRKPDSIQLQEPPPLTDYEKERIESELKQLTQKLTQVAAEQKNLKKTFENFLAQQAEKKHLGQKTADGQSSGGKGSGKGKSAGKGEGKDKGQGKGTGKGKGESQGQGQGQGKGEGKGKGQGEGKTKGHGEGKGQGHGGGKGKGKSAGEGTGESHREAQVADAIGEGAGKGQLSIKHSIASSAERMKLLQAKQKALQEKVSQLKQSLQDLLQIPQADKGAKCQEAQEHLDKATAQMDKFQAKLAEARHKAKMNEAESTEAVGALELADRELELAEETLKGRLTLNDEQMLAKKAQKLAEELSDLADALDESVTPIEREQMLARLEEAKRLLEAMPKPQWVTVGDSVPGGATHVLTRDPGKSPAEAARAVARQFWSITINARKRQGRPITDEPSDVKFYELESEFFESAAKLGSTPVQK